MAIDHTADQRAAIERATEYCLGMYAVDELIAAGGGADRLAADVMAADADGHVRELDAGDGRWPGLFRGGRLDD